MRSIDQLIDGNGALRQLGIALAARRALLRQVQEALPPDLAPHCVAATLEGDELHLLADSAGWATRLRYLGRELTRQLRGAGLRVSAVQVRVLPPDATPARAGSRPARHSDSAASCLEGTADGITDPALRAALQRLGRRLRR